MCFGDKQGNGCLRAFDMSFSLLGRVRPGYWVVCHVKERTMDREHNYILLSLEKINNF